VILLRKPLGLGDLVMLSPFVKLIEEKFDKVFVISEYDNFFKYKKIEFIKPDEITNNLIKNSLVISPILVFSHLKYIFRAKYFIGYFGSNKLVSNFTKINYKYNPKTEHYLEKTFPILDILNIKYDKNNFEYPNIKSKKYDLNIGKYLVIAPYSNWKERQYSKENYIKLITFLLKNFKYKIVLIGSSNPNEIKFNENIASKFEDIINLTGKTSILEMSYIIKNTELFIGNDSGPSHVAYIIAKKVLVFFGSVYYENRLPLNKKLKNKIIALDNRNSCKYFPCYDGYNKPLCKNKDKYSCLDIKVDKNFLIHILEK
jgi:ADP-heptose:LPS heptosyltransferase